MEAVCVFVMAVITVIVDVVVLDEEDEGNGVVLYNALYQCQM